MLTNFGINLNKFNFLLISKEYKEISFIQQIGKSVTLNYISLTNHTDLNQIVIECEKFNTIIFTQDNTISISSTQPFNNISTLEFKYKTFKISDDTLIILL